MENSTATPQQAVQVNASQAHIIQQGGTTTAPIQIFAQDGGGAGKAFYIIDPSQVTNGLQMISNADQRFELNSGSTTTASPQTLTAAANAGAQQQANQATVVLNGQQVLAQRVPVAMEALDEPLYVNAKQYHRIIKRRQARAKLEAEGKIPKTRKKYLHESRHLHAVRRNRSMGGRFVGKPNMDLGADEPVTPREQSTLSNVTQHSVSALPTATMLPSHTMIQIQNNIPVMSSTVHNTGPVPIVVSTASGLASS
ncbi:uncharacterized protein [Clytia hemisphaerica]|uniref:Nuclear transcription factor Y subunit n=2 Tax=Clytia hemisphaerica TaxID=252671 RepID=A0A7M5V056_9CNID|eukprot:TCONS_00072790-protein